MALSAHEFYFSKRSAAVPFNRRVLTPLFFFFTSRATSGDLPNKIERLNDAKTAIQFVGFVTSALQATGISTDM